MKIYYLNLEKSIERNKLIEQNLIERKCDYTRIDGIDGSKPEQIYSMFSLRDNFYKKKNRGQLGCLGSHLKAIIKFNNSNDERALILEDDISFKILDDYDLDLNKILDRVVQIVPDNFGIIQLSYIWGSSEPFIANQNRLYRKWNKYYSACAYIISKKGARDIISKLTVDSKINLDLKKESMKRYVADYILYKKTKSYTFKIPLFFQNSDLNSIIGSRSKTHAKALCVIFAVLKIYDRVLRLLI
jgi:GR25 family glycosyltransferase involved in LPS biosynthesis